MTRTTIRAAFVAALLATSAMTMAPALAQRRRYFQPDETCPHHHGAAGGCGLSDDRPTVGEAAQRVDMRQVRARKRQADRLCPGREQQPVIGKRGTIGEADFAGCNIDSSHLRGETQVYILLFVEGGATQRHPVLRRGTGQKILGEIGPVDRQVGIVTQHDQAAGIAQIAQPLGSGEAGRPTASPVRRSKRA